MTRVAVTGVGAISPVGNNVTDAWRAIVAGENGIGPLDIARGHLVTCPIAAQVRDFRPADHFSLKQLSVLDRTSQFAILSAREALSDSGLDPAATASANTPVIIGTGVGGMNTLDDNFHAIYGEGKPRVHPLSIPKLMTNAPASQISMDLGLHGMTLAIASACASGAHAVGMAFQMIRSGAARIAVCGGTEACITAGTMLGWEALRVLSSDTCRPFAANRSGLVLGEGAATLVLEEWAQAVDRGARIYAEVTGFGANADAADLTSPDPGSTRQAMEIAMKDAGLVASQIDYINAHGTGTNMNDRIESGIICDLFRDAPLPLVSSTKGALGHSLGATGAMEALLTVKALHHQVVPPTANCEQPDETLGLDLVTQTARHVRIRHALSNSFAFGGLNAVLAFSAVD
ncbi:beta-ketoacyl-[acyl-carrier-protein] synthase family protein [Sphingobium limneticum]|uniref:beta-ketoacyl-[acyl-carrier-protein] synthase family protein n=1 Tax=Sphingobium limneticum TaxID=1007511 RepID=UPI00123D8230|nr:beta-ketoacyl-[acyl-carrier-protein] synthase family protein [Sphingobium limneticum]KAA9013009.1 beta-ketoacyl-[acyl-carrier-protein] synthase family protein [Sphingobium limneticum]